MDIACKEQSYITTTTMNKKKETKNGMENVIKI